MTRFSRRTVLTGLGAGMIAGAANAQHAHHGGLYESLQKPGRHGPPEIAAQQHVFDSPAKKAATPGKWLTKAALPVPRSEMAWAVSQGDQMHLLGGYGEQRVDRPYHQVYCASKDQWVEMAPLPKGANHVSVVIQDNCLYALGGFVEQNRKPHNECFVFDMVTNTWTGIAPFPRACGATAWVSNNGILHVRHGCCDQSASFIA